MGERRLTDEVVQALLSNPNVKDVREGRVYLTYEFRVKMYEAWIENPKPETVRTMLTANGFDNAALGKDFAKDTCKTFKRWGHPTAGSGIAGRKQNRYSREEADRILLSTGKFRKKRNGIGFEESFIEELRAGYPETSFEEGIRAAGIDPELVGYQRIYQLEKRMNGTELRKHSRASIYSSAEVDHLRTHPYVQRVSEKKIIFRRELYAESKVLLSNRYSVESILEIYEIPESILRRGSKNNFVFRIRNAGNAPCKEQQPIWTELPSEQQTRYLRIQRKRLIALDDIAQRNFLLLKESLHGLRRIQKIQIFQWLQSSVPKERNGKYSLRGMLQTIGASKSMYYGVLSDSTYEKRAQQQAERREEDKDIIRQVAEYGGYPKGSRQIYMQMEVLTGRRMSRGKIMKLMKEMGIQSTVRQANPARRGALKHLKKNVKPNILKRTFRLHRPGEVYLTDVTYLKYGRNKLAYGSACVDSVTGRVYSFDISECNDLELVEETVRKLPRLEDAYEALKPILHTDQGVLYLTDEFQELVSELGFVQSMSKRGNCWDNAPQESFFGHFKDECSYRKSQTLDELREEIQRYVRYYNEIRGHWNRNKMTPVKFEEYLQNMTDEEFQQWRHAEEARYNQMKQRAKEKAIERARTLGV